MLLFLWRAQSAPAGSQKQRAGPPKTHLQLLKHEEERDAVAAEQLERHLLDTRERGVDVEADCELVEDTDRLWSKEGWAGTDGQGGMSRDAQGSEWRHRDQGGRD
jgi:hypothetical protein